MVLGVPIFKYLRVKFWDIFIPLINALQVL